MKQLLGRSPLPRIYAAATRSSLRVLAYHGVADARTFAAQVDLLRKDYRPVSISDVHAALHGGRPLPARAVLITFDDGDRTVFDHALPFLADAGLPAVIYVVSGLIDTEDAFWWDEASVLAERGARAQGIRTDEPADLVRALKVMPDDRRRALLNEMRDAAGPVRAAQLRASELRDLEGASIAVGNHTASHPCLDRCDDETLVNEITRAHARLTDILGHSPDTFAYPNGNLDRRAEPVLRQLGYRSAFLFDHALQPLPTDPLRLSRLRIDAHVDIDTFALMASGAHSALHHRVLRRS